MSKSASCLKVRMPGSGQDPKTKSSIQQLRLYELLTVRVLQAIEVCLCLKTFD